MKMKTSFLFFLLCIGLSACSPKTKVETALPTVKVALVKEGSLLKTISIHGTLSPLPNHEAIVRAPFSGTLQEIFVSPNENVKKGEIVAILFTPLLQAQIKEAKAQLASALSQDNQAETSFFSAKAVLVNAQENLIRQEKLFKDGIVSQKAVQDAKLAQKEASAAVLDKQAQIEVAKQEVKRAQAQLFNAQAQLSLATIRAPISGTVASVQASRGEIVSPSDTLLTIVDDKSLQFVAGLQSADLPNVHIGENVRFTTQSLPKQTFEGIVQGISPQVDLQSGTIPVTILVKNQSALLKDNMVAVGEILVGNERGLLVPKSALLVNPQTGQNEIVAVGKENKTKTIPVLVKFSNEKEAEIEGNLHVGERIAIEGEYALPEGTVVNPVEVKP
jgi:multidrug efflux pump subunit AcrA (membrane-fusion protein)